MAIKGSIRGGHNYGVQGASGIVNEVTEDRKYYALVLQGLKANGFAMQDVTPNRTATTGQDLSYGVRLANNNASNFFMSCHLNCYNGSAKGCEVVYSSASGQKLAQCIVNELAKLGFSNRGAKRDDRGLYELRHTNMTAVIIEPFFCDNAEDVAIYRRVGAKGIADAIVRGVCNYYGKSANTSSSSSNISNNSSNSTLLRKGSRGDSVRQLQSNLIKLGYSVGSYGADGCFGQGTYDAVVKFQQANGLGVDGIVGNGTLNKINQLLNPPKPSFKPLPLKMRYDSPAINYKSDSQFFNIVKFYYRND